jgi:cytoskeletal protein CcmA (bactofilin family)
VIGAVTAKQVRLYATAVVDGDITHEQLAMEVGASFQGRSMKFQRPAGAQASPTPEARPAAPAKAAVDPARDGPAAPPASAPH